MNYKTLVEDLKKLKGLNLNSIRPGSNITIQDIDEEQNSIVIITPSGAMKRRSLKEIERIWDALSTHSVVHVDEVLHGSGTSRNQPETILANLPYIEWVKINNKKHIAFVGSETHPFGTLRQMDAMDAAVLIEEAQYVNSRKQYSTVLVFNNVQEGISALNQVFLGTVETINRGAYAFHTGSESILLIAAEETELDEGAYVVLENAQLTSTGGRRVQLLNENYILSKVGTTNALTKEKSVNTRSEASNLKYEFPRGETTLKVADGGSMDNISKASTKE